MEFTEVFKQVQRLCKYMKCRCNECPLKNVTESEGCTLKPWGVDCDLGEAEQRVMQWAQEHKEPIYPTWAEWLISIGALGSLENRDNDFTAEEILWKMHDRMFMPIPDDIAGKLRLKPKKANEDAIIWT